MSSALSSASWFCPRPRPQEFGLMQHHCKRVVVLRFVSWMNDVVVCSCARQDALMRKRSSLSLKRPTVSTTRWYVMTPTVMMAAALRVITRESLITAKTRTWAGTRYPLQLVTSLQSTSVDHYTSANEWPSMTLEYYFMLKSVFCVGLTGFFLRGFWSQLRESE